MKVLAISTDRKIFEEGSAVRERMIEYGKIFDELHVVVFTQQSLGLRAESFQLGANVWVYPTNSKSKLFYIFDAFRIGKALSSKLLASSSVVSTQDPFETGLVGLFLKLRYKLPLQIQLHTDFANRYFILHSLLNFLRFPIGLIVLSFADSVRVVSERIAKSIHSLSHNISVLPIYTEANSLELRANVIQEKDGKIVFLTVARLEKEKDLGTAIKAFKKVLDQGIGVEFVIVGDGKERKSLELLTKSLGIGDRVKFVGWQNDLNEYYEKADIYVSTSLYEGYGMSVIEAAQHGLALVISDTGVAGDIFINNDNALICKQGDVGGFADAMWRVSSDSRFMVELGTKAKASVASRQIDLTEYLSNYKESVMVASRFFNSGQGIFKKNILLRYLVAGITGASTQIGLLYIFTDVLNFWYLYSSIFSFLAAILVSFFLQKFWTFADTETGKIHHQFGKYLMVAVLGLLLNTGSMFILVDIFNLWYILAQIITGAFIAIMNFLLYKFFIFHKS